MTSLIADINGTVLISAGASGIGRTIAETFLSHGASVHICDVSQENIDAFLGDNAGASATLADVSVAAQVERVFDDLVELYGGLNVLVNNAGIAGPMAPIDEIGIEDWHRCIGIDLNSAFFMTRLAVPLLRKSDGAAIINIASTSGLFGSPLRSPYAAAKWGLVGLTKTWAMELGAAGIRVNAICPGSVEGARIERVIEREAAKRDITAEQVRDAYLRQSSMQQFVSPEDIAAQVVFLASRQGAKISGQAIAIDGNTEGLSNSLD
jgi:NAD(P)-dependent dehydrogenase (short-subunit alcohol dehydrogenase family)